MSSFCLVSCSQQQATLLVLFSSQFNSSWVPLKESILYNFTRTKFVLTSAASASAASNKYHDCAGKALAVVGFKPLHRQCTVRLWRAICTNALSKHYAVHNMICNSQQHTINKTKTNLQRFAHFAIWWICSLDVRHGVRIVHRMVGESVHWVRIILFCTLAASSRVASVL